MFNSLLHGYDEIAGKTNRAKNNIMSIFYPTIEVFSPLMQHLCLHSLRQSSETMQKTTFSISCNCCMAMYIMHMCTTLNSLLGVVNHIPRLGCDMNVKYGKRIDRSNKHILIIDTN